MGIIDLCERGLIPDSLTKFGMRRSINRRLQQELAGGSEAQQQRFRTFIDELKRSPIALSVEEANEQHYELPVEFFLHALGPHLKYSSCYWPTQTTTLAEAEEHMLELTCERAGIVDGDNVLELGCGWGSLTLWMARRFPNSKIVAVSNSTQQKTFILDRAQSRSLGNIEVVTADMNDFDTEHVFDRVVSVEMFEHMRNYQELLSRIARWLKPDGTLFVHIFCHAKVMYPFDVKDQQDWMARYFFTNGIMPARHTLAEFQNDLILEQSWDVSGMHYSRTAYAWLDRQDSARKEIIPAFEKTYGQDQARVWFQRWRMFFMACGEFFATNKGKEWFVAHYFMRKR
ncbi:MAG: cyclopropane-fatty-acyl-phospholipid synthase family protein [Gammaproteobacteria bacterium]